MGLSKLPSWVGKEVLRVICSKECSTPVSECRSNDARLSFLKKGLTYPSHFEIEGVVIGEFKDICKVIKKNKEKMESLSNGCHNEHGTSLKFAILRLSSRQNKGIATIVLAENKELIGIDYWAELGFTSNKKKYNTTVQFKSGVPILKVHLSQEETVYPCLIHQASNSFEPELVKWNVGIRRLQDKVLILDKLKEGYFKICPYSNFR